MINARTKLCIIIGDPVDHSLSPAMHNAAYKHLGIDDQFVFVGSDVKEDELADTIKGIRAMHFRGVTITKPHKTKSMIYVDELDETANAIGAINTIVNDNGKLIGYNTDWLGIVTPIEKLTDLSGKKVAVLGAGGAARSAVYGLTSKGADVTIFNRSIEKAQALAEEFGASFVSLNQLEHVKDMDIIFNATSIGMSPNIDESPLPKDFITDKHIVFDAIYSPLKTKLLKEAREQGAKIITGQNMLLYQGFQQFKLYTGHEAPEEVMRKALNGN